MVSLGVTAKMASAIPAPKPAKGCCVEGLSRIKIDKIVSYAPRRLRGAVTLPLNISEDQPNKGYVRHLPCRQQVDA